MRFLPFSCMHQLQNPGCFPRFEQHYEEIHLMRLSFKKIREIVRNFCEKSLEGIMHLLSGGVPELFLQWTVQCLCFTGEVKQR